MTDRTYNPYETMEQHQIATADVSVGVGTLNAEPDRDIYRVNVDAAEGPRLLSISGLFTTPDSPGFRWLHVTKAWGRLLTLVSFRICGIEQMAGGDRCGVLLSPQLTDTAPIPVNYDMRPGYGFTLRLRIPEGSPGPVGGHGVRLEWIAPKGDDPYGR